jgi:FAD/FMN-containing dehydrogenase
MILANGDLVQASRTERADLFYGAAGSYGSLGIITSAEIRLMPAKLYVQLTHYPVSSLAEAIQLTRRYADWAPTM